MPKGAYLRDKFIKHFAAKAFRFTPQDVDDMDAEELDWLIFIESENNKKEQKERDNESRKLRNKNGR